MKVAVFGGSGGTGQCVITALLDAGIEVRALIRQSGRLEPRTGLEIITGFLSDARALETTLHGCDAACCLFGPRPPYTDIFCAQATPAIVETMQRLGVPRLICQTGAMIGDYPANRTWMMRIMVGLFHRRLPLLAEDRSNQEDIVMTSGLDWTIVKPPRLTNQAAGRSLKAGRDVRIGLFSRVSRSDLAAWIVNELMQPAHVGEAVFIRE